jgi:Protein of unknown function (DUF1566)
LGQLKGELAMKTYLNGRTRWPALMLLGLLAAATGPASAQTRFVPNGAEVLDTETGLIWKRCSEGQKWNGTTCGGKATSPNWRAALAIANAEGGGWRLPNVKELVSLVDLTRSDPTIDPVAFPATLVSSYWSSTPYNDYPEFAWAVGFNIGAVNFWHTDIGYRVRLVRTAP